MSGFIEYLESRSEQDTKVRAVLRRSLAFSPGAFAPAYPYVEPFVKEQGPSWSREAHYLVAGLWASHPRDKSTPPIQPLGRACALHQSKSGSTSTERRFVNLLDADIDQLPHRLRQVVALLKEQSLDFEGLLRGVLFWTDSEKRTQNAWARDFYRSLDSETATESVLQEHITP